MRLKRRLPKDRMFEQIKNHYEVEKSIAERLKNSAREERKAIFANMYDELFAKVNDHPRLKEKENDEKIQASNIQKLKLVKKFLNDLTVFVEFGPGNCNFSLEVSKYVKKVYAVDISDQRRRNYSIPTNFELVVYDGYNLNLEDNSVDVAFSDQFIEHLHPEDAEYHFQLVKRILRNNGRYVFRSPHAFFGPHDISKYFSDEPQGFHLKEWTHSENFTSWHGYWRVNKQINKKYAKIPFCYFKVAEVLLKNLPRKPQRFISRLFLPMKLYMIAVK
jgi:SAM-dependent methyltransferase